MKVSSLIVTVGITALVMNAVLAFFNYSAVKNWVRDITQEENRELVEQLQMLEKRVEELEAQN